MFKHIARSMSFRFEEYLYIIAIGMPIRIGKYTYIYIRAKIEEPRVRIVDTGSPGFNVRTISEEQRVKNYKERQKANSQKLIASCQI
jgi:hypothetical protein